MTDFIYSPLFGVAITVIFMVAAQKFSKGFKTPLMNPLILTLIAIIAFLKVTGIPLEAYEEGGQILTFFLGPVTVALALPLYRQRENLKKHMVPILIGVTVGSLVAVTSVVLLGKAFGFSEGLIVSTAPKSTTTAIAVELSETFGGRPSLTVAFVILAGTTGNIFGEGLLKLLGIKHPTAKGIGMGTASHAFGTNKALEMGPEEGAMSSLAIGLTGIITSVIFPITLSLFL